MALDGDTAAAVGTAGDNPFSFPTHILLNIQGAFNGAPWPFKCRLCEVFMMGHNTLEIFSDYI